MLEHGYDWYPLTGGARLCAQNAGVWPGFIVTEADNGLIVSLTVMRNVSRVRARLELLKASVTARLICELVTETSIGSISQVAEGIHHRVVSGENLVGSFAHDVSYQFERLEANGAAEHPVSAL